MDFNSLDKPGHYATESGILNAPCSEKCYYITVVWGNDIHDSHLQIAYTMRENPRLFVRYWQTGIWGDWKEIGKQTTTYTDADIDTMLDGKVNTADIDGVLSASSENPVQNKAVKSELDKKLNTSSVDNVMPAFPSSSRVPGSAVVHSEDGKYLEYSYYLAMGVNGVNDSRLLNSQATVNNMSYCQIGQEEFEFYCYKTNGLPDGAVFGIFSGDGMMNNERTENGVKYCDIIQYFTNLFTGTVYIRTVSRMYDPNYNEWGTEVPVESCEWEEV